MAKSPAAVKTQPPAPIDSAKLMDVLQRSPEMRAVIQRDADEVAAERARLAKLRAETLAQPVVGPSESEIAAAAAALNAAVKAEAAARLKLLTLQTGRAGASAERWARIEEIEAQLAATASPRIADFIRWLSDEHESTRKGTATHSATLPEMSVVNSIINKADFQIEENQRRDRVRARLAAIREMMTTAAELRFVADQREIPARIEVLKASLPSVSGK